MRAGIAAFDTTQIDAAFGGVGPALVIHVDAAGLAEVMLGRVRAPGVQAEVPSTL